MKSDEAAQVFDSVADSYERYDDSPVARRIVQAIRRDVHSEVRTAGRIVDVGCGPGTLALCLASDGYDIHATDVSQAMLQTVVRRADQAGLAITTHLHDIAAAPLEGRPFDAAIATMGPLNYTIDPRRRMLNLRASLRDGGTAWLALARAASFPRALRAPRPWLLPFLRRAPICIEGSVQGRPLNVFVWDPYVFMERYGTGWRLEDLRAIALSSRLPDSLNKRLERRTFLRRLGAVSLLRLRAV